ncbi:hypothetical protein DB29_01636 [Shouchella clausii]|nr:hypothetical protein DB29_01636 [Shouchella clausii]
MIVSSLIVSEWGYTCLKTRVKRGEIMVNVAIASMNGANM